MDVIAGINERPRRVISAYLIQDKNDQPLIQFALHSRLAAQLIDN
ncbi:hypothetical protein [Polaromonas aquatica]